MKPYTTKLRCFYFWRPETESAGDFTPSLPGSCAIKFNMAGNVQFLDLTIGSNAKFCPLEPPSWILQFATLIGPSRRSMSPISMDLALRRHPYLMFNLRR